VTKLGIDKSRIKLKWPNDVLGDINGIPKKISGILSESEQYTINGLPSVVAFVGIGINFDSKPTEDFCSIPDINNGKTIDRGEFLVEFFDNLNYYLHENEMHRALITTDKGQSEIVKEIQDVWMHSGQVVDVDSPELGTFKAKIAGLSKTGYLKVQTDTDTYEVN
jgi:biotin-(acetyl-CoA carboxylase) ligase